jgi:hypothetical protein
MARKQSVILTAADARAALIAARTAVKDAKANLAEANKARKELEGQYKRALKAKDKDIAAIQKELAAAEAALLKHSSSVAKKAKPSPVGV